MLYSMCLVVAGIKESSLLSANIQLTVSFLLASVGFRLNTHKIVKSFIVTLGKLRIMFPSDTYTL